MEVSTFILDKLNLLRKKKDLYDPEEYEKKLSELKHELIELGRYRNEIKEKIHVSGYQHIINNPESVNNFRVRPEQLN